MNGSRFVRDRCGTGFGPRVVMITENLVDQPFLDKYCVGYDEKRCPPVRQPMVITKLTFLAGTDGIAKTPEWASTITGIPRERIVKLAREIATAKPAYCRAGVRSVTPTVRSPPAPSQCSPF